MILKKSFVNDFITLLVSIIVSIVYLALYPFLVYFNSGKERPTPSPKAIVITGATSGIGYSLACEYSKQYDGIVLGLIGRNKGRLIEIKEELSKNGTIVEIGEIDITDKGAMESWLLRFDNKYKIDIVIANAGTAESMLSDKLSYVEKATQTANVNVMGTLNTILPLLERFESRNSGQIVLISSISIYFNTMAPSYTGTKGFISSFGLTLRNQLIDTGVGVSTVLVGFVKTPLLASGLDESSYNMVFPVTPEQAASHIIHGVKNNDRLIIFPFSSLLMCININCFPQNLKDSLNKIVLKLLSNGKNNINPTKN